MLRLRRPGLCLDLIYSVGGFEIVMRCGIVMVRRHGGDGGDDAKDRECVMVIMNNTIISCSLPTAIF
jgi:hypothetical protein